MSSINSIGTSSNLLGTSNYVTKNSLDKQAFLNLLVTQLKYQDPLNPMENTEFVAQLSQFSQLEQLYNVNESLRAETVFSKSIYGSSMASLVGKEVKAVGSLVTLPETGEIDLYYSIPEEANVTIAIFDESENLVRTIKVGTQEAGYQSISWNGLDDDGDRVSAGEYSFSITAVDAEGNAVTASSIIRGQISGVRFVDGYPILLINNQETSPENVIEILQP